MTSHVQAAVLHVMNKVKVIALTTLLALITTVKAITGGRYLRPAVRAGCGCAVYLREPVLPTSSKVLQAWACWVVPVSWPCQGVCEASKRWSNGAM